MFFLPNQTKPKKCNASVVLTSPPFPQIILKQFLATFSLTISKICLLQKTSDLPIYDNSTSRALPIVRKSAVSVYYL